MELHQLRYFVAVAETGSFSRAAQHCHVAQPSLSQQIKKLENGLGQQLFDRLGRGAVLTDAGRVLLPRARRILAEVRQVTQDMADEVGVEGIPLRVGAIPTMAPYLLPEVVRDLRARHPDCVLEITEDLTDELVRLTIDSEIDCAVVSTPIDSRLLEIDVLGQERLVLAAHGGLELPAELELAILEELPVVVIHEMHCLGQQIAGFCSTERVHPRIVCRSTQLSTVLRMVALGLGVSVVPEMASSPDETTRELGNQFRPIGREPLSRDIALIWRRGRTMPRLAGELADAVRQTLRASSEAAAS